MASRAQLRGGRPPRPIAYPHGAADERVAAAAREPAIPFGSRAPTARAVTPRDDPLLVGAATPSGSSRWPPLRAQPRPELLAQSATIATVGARSAVTWGALAVVLPTLDRRRHARSTPSGASVRSSSDEPWSMRSPALGACDDGSSDGTAADSTACARSRPALRHDRARRRPARARATRHPRRARHVARLPRTTTIYGARTSRATAPATAAATGAGLVSRPRDRDRERSSPVCAAREELVDSSRLAARAAARTCPATISSGCVHRPRHPPPARLDAAAGRCSPTGICGPVIGPARSRVVCPEPPLSYTEHPATAFHDRAGLSKPSASSPTRPKHRALVDGRGGRALGSARWWRWVAAGHRRAGRRRRAGGPISRAARRVTAAGAPWSTR